VRGDNPQQLDSVIRAKKPVRLPVVFSRDEVHAVLSNLEGDKQLAAKLLYGTGMRLNECLNLRIQDIDFDLDEILIRNGKGTKDRRTMLPQILIKPLRDHVLKVKKIHEADLAAGWGKTPLPGALDKKYPNAVVDFRWQLVFPPPRKIAGRIRRQVRKVAIIWMLQLWSEQCKQQFVRRESVNMHAAIPSDIHLPLIL